MTFLSQRWFRWASARVARLAWCFGGFPSKSWYRAWTIQLRSNNCKQHPDSRRFNPFLSFHVITQDAETHPLHWGWNWAPGVLNILRPCLVGCWWDVDFAFSLLWRRAYSTLNHSCGGDIIPNLSGFESSCYTTKQPQWTPRTFSPFTVFFVGAGYHATLQLLFSRNFR